MDVLRTVDVVLPSAAETLLFRACLWEGPAAGEAWNAWCARLGDPTDTFRGSQAPLRGLGPLLDASLRRAGADAGSPKMATTLRTAAAREELRAATLREVIAARLAAVADPVVVKGAALADSVYPGPGLRHTHGLDLLVAPDAPATRRLTDSGVPVDDHPSLFVAAYHRGAEPEMRARLVEARVAGRPVRTLAPDDALAHVCVHAFTLGGAKRAQWVPDAWFLLRAHADLDWDRLLATAQRGRMAIPLACLLGYLRADLDAPVPAPVLAALEGEAGAAGSTERDVALASAWRARGSDRALESADRRRSLALARWAIAPAPGYLRVTRRAGGAFGVARGYAGRPWRALRRRARGPVSAD